MSELEKFRKEKDELFRTSPQSPIPTEELDSFEGLKYYPENQDLRFEVSVEEVPEEDLEFETSTGEKRVYKKVGKLVFEVAGEQQLTLYQADLPAGKAGSGSYLLPFRDATSGKETYGAGRYLEVKKVGGPPPSAGSRQRREKIELDFNFAYNPYCAYNPSYSCPLPPAENWLKVPIEAGEKAFHD